mgnify:CR=1 FL=1
MNKNKLLLASMALLASTVTLAEPIVNGYYDISRDLGVDGSINEVSWSERYHCTGSVAEIINTATSTTGGTENEFSCYRTQINGQPDTSNWPSTIEGKITSHPYSYRPMEALTMTIHAEPSAQITQIGTREKGSNDPIKGMWLSNQTAANGQYAFQGQAARGGDFIFSSVAE